MACVVLGCKTQSSRNKDDTISFHRFPGDEEVKQKWIDAVWRPKWYWKKHHRLCSKHFEDRCFIDVNTKWRRLKPSAVPTLLLCKDVVMIEQKYDPETGIDKKIYVSTNSKEVAQLKMRIKQLEKSLQRANEVSKQRLLKINQLKQVVRRLRKKTTDLATKLKELEAQKEYRDKIHTFDTVIIVQ